MENDKSRYIIHNLAEQISEIVDALDLGSEHYNNTIAIALGIDYGADYNRYWNYLYSLYDLAESRGFLDEDMLEDLPKFQEIAQERADELADNQHEDIIYSIEEGDKVRLYNGNVRYIVSIDGNDLWVSLRRGDPSGWYANRDDVVEILEKYDESGEY